MATEGEGAGSTQDVGSISSGIGTAAEDRAVGQIAVEKKLITPEQFREAVEDQRRAREAGRTVILGQILVEREWIRIDDLIRLITELKARVGATPQIARYDVRERLGEGTTAVVYRAWDRQLNRAVALKVLRETMGLSEVARLRFQREAQAAAGLSHPNVVTVHDAGEAEGRPYLVMELVEGRPLNQILRDGSVEERKVLEIIEKAARGLDSAHAKGIVHRDLKPANILVTGSGEPKVGDFGLAHFVDSEAELTRTGTALGTPLYMSPEQVVGDSKAIAPQSDVFALGSILYEAVTGHPPHLGETMREIYDKVVRDVPPSPRSLNPKLSVDLETIILKSLDKDPRRRYPAAGAFADDLRRYLNGEPIEARPPSAPAILWRWTVQHRRIVLSAPLALLGALLGAWALVRLQDSPLVPGRSMLSEAYEKEWTRAVHLLPLVDADRDEVRGLWGKEPGRLYCGRSAFSMIQIPYRPPEEYDLRVVFTKREGFGDVNLLLSHANRKFLWVMGAHGNTTFGFAQVKGGWVDDNPTTRKEAVCLKDGQRYTAVVQVRKDGLWAYLDGRLKVGWATDYSDIGGDSGWNLPDNDKLGLGTYESPTDFWEVDLLEVTGKGRVAQRGP